MQKYVYLFTLLVFVVWLGGLVGAASAAAQTLKKNIVLVLSDDQDLLLGSLEWMSATKQFMIREGTSMTNHFTSTPVCCPSRSSIITGRFPHNYKQQTKHSKTSCLDPESDDSTVFVKLHEAGYRVGLFGKHMNEDGMGPYCPQSEGDQGEMPSGIDHYLAMCPDTCYVDCVFAKGDTYGGTTEWVRPKDHAGYHTSIIGNRTLTFVRDTVEANIPFFVYVSPHAPHLPCTPAPWYEDAPIAGGAPRNPAFNASSSDKHWMVAQQPPLSAKDAQQLDEIFRNRTKTLLSVDDIVHDVVGLLKELNVDNNTYVVYTSDHGFHLGSYRLGAAKRQVYDTDLRVPLLVRGPNIRQNANVSILSSHVDLAPTLMDMAGLLPDLSMDGKSLLPALTNVATPSSSSAWRTQIYVEYQGLGTVGRDVLRRIQRCPNNTFAGIRRVEKDADLLYSEFDASNVDFTFQDPEFVEMYRFSNDPYQLSNRAQIESQGTIRELRESLHSMLNCSGSSADAETASCFV